MRTSVVIPSHNAAPYLDEAIASALAAHQEVDEVIVVDDASADDSLARARAWEERVPHRVRVLAIEARHAGCARNVGAAHARGDALLFLDADDVLGDAAVPMLRARLAERAAAVAIGPWRRLEHVDGGWVVRPPSCAPRAPGEDPLSAWMKGWYHPPCSVLWSREAFDHAGGWDEAAPINQDGDLMMRALVYGTPLLEADRGVSYYRRLPAGGDSVSSRRRTVAGLRGRLYVMSKIAWLLVAHERVPAYRAALRTAFDRIAQDAVGIDAALAREAQSLAREFCGSRPWQHGSAAGETSAVRPRLHAPPRRALVPGPAPAPTVSVIIPTYNRAASLARTLASVLAQSFADLEVLVIDDGSTDETPAVMARVDDDRVRYLRQSENQGVAAARNRGMRAARGEFIAFLDSDDEWLPEKLAAQVARFRESPPSIGLLYTGVETVHEDGTRTVQAASLRGDLYAQLLCRNVIHGGGSNVMIRRGVLAVAGFFNPTLPASEDHDYWLRLSRFFDVDCDPAPLVRYHDRQVPGRRSRVLRANLEARWRLYRTYRAQMRAAATSQLYLLHTIRWAEAHAGADRASLRRFAFHALRERPISRMAIATLARNLSPQAEAVPWIQRHAAR